MKPSGLQLCLLAALMSACASPTPRPSPPSAWRDIDAADDALARDDTTAAIRHLRTAADRAPESPESRLRLARMLLVDDPAGALAALDPLVAGPPTVFLLRARAHLRLRDPDAADRDLARLVATDLAPGPDAYVVKAGIARARGDEAGAERALRQALVLDDGHPEALAGLLRIASARGDAAAVEDATERLRRAAPGHPALVPPGGGDPDRSRRSH